MANGQLTAGAVNGGVQGGVAGASFGPIGAAIGGVVGAGAGWLGGGGIDNLFGHKKKPLPPPKPFYDSPEFIVLFVVIGLVVLVVVKKSKA